MLQAKLDTVLFSDLNQTIVEGVEPAATPEAAMEDALNDQMWLSNNLDMDFWTCLEDDPLLAWPELAEILSLANRMWLIVAGRNWSADKMNHCATSCSTWESQKTT